MSSTGFRRATGCAHLAGTIRLPVIPGNFLFTSSRSSPEVTLRAQTVKRDKLRSDCRLPQSAEKSSLFPDKAVSGQSSSVDQMEPTVVARPVCGALCTCVVIGKDSSIVAMRALAGGCMEPVPASDFAYANFVSAI